MSKYLNPLIYSYLQSYSCKITSGLMEVYEKSLALDLCITLHSVRHSMRGRERVEVGCNVACRCNSTCGH